MLYFFANLIFNKLEIQIGDAKISVSFWIRLKNYEKNKITNLYKKNVIQLKSISKKIMLIIVYQILDEVGVHS